MDIQITGEVIEVLEEQSGTGKNGPWRKQEFILETEGQYPKKICVTQWGDRIDEFDVQEGERITAHVDLQSREYEGRWYTDVKAWKVERPAEGNGGGGPGDPLADSPEFDRFDEEADTGETDDLPF